MHDDAEKSRFSRRNALLGAVLAYVAIVLALDMTAALVAKGHFRNTALEWLPIDGTKLIAVVRDYTPWDWTVLRWYPFRGYGALTRFDAFKFVFWFVIPFACCVPWMDWGAWGVKRWKWWDAILLAALIPVGIGAMALIPLVPSLSELYGGGGSVRPGGRMAFFLGYLVWYCSWLIGWEFLHRYALLRAADGVWPRWGWLLVPLSEGLYHLQKPGLEALGMIAFSVVLTLYALRRKNLLLPLLAHLIIEMELVFYMAFFAG